MSDERRCKESVQYGVCGTILRGPHETSGGVFWYCPVEHVKVTQCPRCRSPNVGPFKVGFGFVKTHCWACGAVW